MAKRAKAKRAPRELLSMRQYAESRRARGLPGGSHVAVRKAIHEGRLTTDSANKRGNRWLIDPVLADREWSANTTSPKQRDPELLSSARKRAAQERRAEQLRAEQGRLFEGDDPAPARRGTPTAAADARDGETMAKVQRYRAMIDARMADLRYRRAAGELVDRGDVERTTFEVFRGLRDRILGVVERISAVLAAERNESQVRELLRDELAGALEAYAAEVREPGSTREAG